MENNHFETPEDQEVFDITRFLYLALFVGFIFGIVFTLIGEWIYFLLK
jgi:hypothetical protein